MSSIEVGSETKARPAAKAKAADPPPRPRDAAGAHPPIEQLSASIERALASIDAQLATKAWLFADPERRKALSRGRDFLQRIRESLDDPATSSMGPLPWAATKALVARAGDEKQRTGRENAWDLAEELRLASWSFSSDEALACLLEKEKADTTSITWTTLFPKEQLERLLARPRPAGFRAEALEHLRRLHHERVDRVRHDRARDKLWQHFVWKLIPIAYALHIVCLVSTKPQPILPVMAGAIGSMLSAVMKLREGEQRIRHLRRSASFLLLQPLIGGTAALVMMWIGVGELLNIKAVDMNATLGFLAGFSEPFFLGTVGRLVEVAANGKSKSEGEKAEGALRKKASS